MRASIIVHHLDCVEDEEVIIYKAPWSELPGQNDSITHYFAIFIFHYNEHCICFDNQALFKAHYLVVNLNESENTP